MGSMEKPMNKKQRQLIDEIIKNATTVMHEMSDMMEGYEMDDYADKCLMLDNLWGAIDDYLKEVKDEQWFDEMEDLGLS